MSVVPLYVPAGRLLHGAGAGGASPSRGSPSTPPLWYLPRTYSFTPQWTAMFFPPEALPLHFSCLSPFRVNFWSYHTQIIGAAIQCA